MASRDITALARTPHDAYNDRDFEHAGQLFTDDATWTDRASGVVYRGPDGFRRWQMGWATAFPDSRVEVVGVRTGDDFAVVEYIGRGTQTGPLETPMGTIPPTNRKGECAFCDLYEIRDGRITSGETYYDSMTIARQLGIVPDEMPATT